MIEINYNIALIIEYDGSNYYGFQKQIGVQTIQNQLEQALFLFTNQKVDVITAGRTDTGVHAIYQVVNFITTVKRNLNSWVRGVNAFLPKDIVIKEAANVPLEFNARFDAISRTYHYYLYNNFIRSALLYKRVGWYQRKLDINKMKKAASYLIGEHDFSCFRASSCQANTPNRTITNFTIDNKENIIKFEITANAFLHHMVRNIIGSLVYIGDGKINLEYFLQILKDLDRRNAPPTFMADGLYLAKVIYPENYFSCNPLNWLF